MEKHFYFSILQRGVNTRSISSHTSRNFKGYDWSFVVLSIFNKSLILGISTKNQIGDWIYKSIEKSKDSKTPTLSPLRYLVLAGTLLLLAVTLQYILNN